MIRAANITAECDDGPIRRRSHVAPNELESSVAHTNFRAWQTTALVEHLDQLGLVPAGEPLGKAGIMSRHE